MKIPASILYLTFPPILSPNSFEDKFFIYLKFLLKLLYLIPDLNKNKNPTTRATMMTIIDIIMVIMQHLFIKKNLFLDFIKKN